MADEDMDGLELTCFQIISYVGTAKSFYVNATKKAKEGDFDGARALIKQGDEVYAKGHDVHMHLLQADAAGSREPVAPLILLHAEDQMMAAETVRLLAENVIDLREEIATLKH